MTLVQVIALLALGLSGRSLAFVPIGGGAPTHISITGTALLQKVTETCQAVADAAGHDFKPTGLSPEELVQACLGPTATGEVSGAKFHSALQEIYTQNGLVDRDFVNSAPHHFNSEAFLEGRRLITEGVLAIKANIRNKNFKAARETLGRVLHTLQDFYSHSNWVELGYTEPYINLIRPDLPLDNLADVDTATCSDCSRGTCPNPILRNILKEKKLTSGYMGIFSAAKPKEFGPMIRTTDADIMKREISKLTAKGGGDHPEMCLSGLQLALTGAPASSDIYVFTDATAKDIELKDTIVALIRTSKSTVSFFMTRVLKRRRRSLRAGSFEDYKELALASGGQAIQVSKGQLPQATDIILDTSTSALVTVLQRARNPGKQETFTFMLDESLTNITIYITGTSISFTLTNPAGVSQSHNEASGKLGTIKTAGNLNRIRLNADSQTGAWQIKFNSNQPYTLKVTGQSTITFIYDFVERFEGPHPGYAVLSGRPQAGQPATLMLSLIGRKGPSSVSVGAVSLVTVSGPETESHGRATEMGNGDILVTVGAVPEGEFVVSLNGTDKVSNNVFQRQSTTQMSVSKVNIKAVVDSSAEPGKALELPFSVKTQGSGGKYSITAKNDRDIHMSYPESLTLTAGKYANATLTIKPPASTPSGTAVTLTLEAKSASGVDSNYVVLRISVVTKITDFVPPLCEVVSVLADDCPQDVSQCGPFQWEFLANLTDGNGTGIEKITLQQGNGNLTYTSLSAPSVQAHYTASCCSQNVEITAVDKVGNVGKCYHSIERSAGPPALSLSLPLWLCLLLSALVGRP
uniref:von Willebrand factor A domain-containing protein 7-like n=1 Tax=Semicossyphus pulcher TaxID=241346 RepID=UPI0037E8EEE0